jgi:carbon storage regulator CsrA
MLVLARQRYERIVMPGIPATIEVVAIRPHGVRLGIEAPPEVVILREEVLRRDGVPPTPRVKAEPDAEARLAQVRHVLRNRLHAVALGLELLRRQPHDCSASESEAMLHRLEEEVRTLDQQLRLVLDAPLDEQLLADGLGQPVLADWPR